MKVLLAVAAAAWTFPVAAAFTVTAPITLGGKDALHRLELPFEVHRDARPDLADVRVLDGSGEEVPYGFAPEPPPGKEPVSGTMLTLFPVSKREVATTSGPDISIRTPEGTAVSIRGGRVTTTGEGKPAAWIADASALKDPIAALVFEWDAGPGTQVVHVHVSASDDLRSWSPIGSVPLVHVEQEGRILAQPRMEIAPRRAKYWRITWDGPAFALKSVRAEPEAKQGRRTRHTSRTEGTVAVPGEWTYDLGARLPVEAVRLLPAQANDVIAATFSIRNDAREAWRPVARAPFYRFEREGIETQSPPLEIGLATARYWRVQTTASRVAPQLEVTWPPRDIVFTARGEGPFTLAFGDAQIRSTALPLESLMPGYERGAERKLPLAKAGQVLRGPPPSRWERWTQAPPKRIALWAVLVVGVGLLGLMAWRLMKTP
jgi:hypothetical protein